jgi:hypothetical protein
MKGLTWETPPTPGHGYDWESISVMLRENPGEWLKIFDTGPVSIANAIRGNGIRVLQPYIAPGKTGSGFNVRTRNNNTSTRTCTLYVRFTGEEG